MRELQERGEGDDPADDALPSWRSRYEDLGELARGGLSSVRIVFDRIVRRRVAMKVHDSARDPLGIAHFLEEARITGQLDHPNIIPVHDVQYDRRALPSRFTMKLVEGETLADWLARRGPKPLRGEELEQRLGVFLKVCDAVSFAHSRGVIHCDLKPSNVMVGSHGQVYVTDWGLALRRRPAGAPALASGTGSAAEVAPRAAGTPAFMAPEQAQGRQDAIDERTDVYGLGGLLFAILTSAAPRDGGSAAADLDLALRGVVRRPEDVPGVVETLPPGLCKIAMRALAAAPGARHASADAIKREVEEFLRGGGWFETIELGEGALIVSEGDVPDAAYILLEGQCEMFHDVAAEKVSVGLLGPGDVFGEIAIFGAAQRTASVVALCDVRLVRVTRDALECELERSGWLKTFVEALAQRFIGVDRELREYERRASDGSQA